MGLLDHLEELDRQYEQSQQKQQPVSQRLAQPVQQQVSETGMPERRRTLGTAATGAVVNFIPSLVKTLQIPWLAWVLFR